MLKLPKRWLKLQIICKFHKSFRWVLKCCQNLGNILKRAKMCERLQKVTKIQLAKSCKKSVNVENIPSKLQMGAKNVFKSCKKLGNILKRAKMCEKFQKVAKSYKKI